MAKLSSDQRNKLNDSDFGIPEERMYPLHDKAHVESAAKLFGKADVKYKKSLARKILRRAKDFNIDTSGWSEVLKYAQEQVPPMSDGTSIGNAPPGTFAAYNEEDELLKRGKMLQKPDPLTLERVREVVAKIHAKYEADSKPPTGNQNCMLCTWCAEAQFRGIDVLPRPIYSPRDPALDARESIVLSPVRLQFKSMSDMMGAIADIPYGRFYVHVKWKGGPGGHEFLLVGLNVPFVVDAQAGFVEPITSAEVQKDYFDIDWHESYLCRLDDKELNRPILDSMNDPAKVVPWDAELDVPYMKERGMLGDMSNMWSMRPATEDDLEFVYFSELETVDENKDDPKVQSYIREDAKASLGYTKIIMAENSDIGVYQAYETNYYGLREGKRDWWYLAHIYIKPEYRTLGIGSAIIKKDIEDHDKILLQVMKSNPRAKKLYESLGFVVTQENDHGGLIMRLDKAKSEAVQEVACAASLLTVKNQLSQQLGSDYEFIGGSLVPKFTIKSKQKPDLSFEVNVNGANIEVTPCYNNIPDFIHKRKGIAFMQAANVVAKFIEDTVREYKPVQESFISGYMPKHEWPDFAKMKIDHIRKWPHNEHGDEDGWEVDEDDGTFTSRLDQNVGFWLIKVFKYWAMVPDFAWDIKELGDFDFDPYNEVDENDWPLDMSWPNIINDLLRETIRASEATVWLVEDFDLLPEDRQKIHEGYSKFDHKEFIENMTDVGNLAEQMLDSPVLHINDLNHEVTPEDMKQIADIRDVGKLFIDIVYDWVNNYQSKGIKEMYLREMKSYDRRDRPKKGAPVQEGATMDFKDDELLSVLKNSKYGVAYHDKLITNPSEQDYMNKWHCLSPNEFINVGGGVCYDFVEWESDYLKKHQIPFKKFHISHHIGFDKTDVGKDAATHSICVAIVNGKYMYIEGSSKKLAKAMGYIKEFNNIDELLDFAVKHTIHDPEQSKLIIIDYTNVDNLIGLNLFDYQNRIFSKGKVITSDFIQEGAFQDLKNGVNPYSDDLVFHVSMDKHIDGQVWQPRVPDYLEPYNPEDTGFEDNTTGRICFSTSIEGALNGITVNLPRQNPAQFDKMYVYIPEKPWKEYKHKTNKQLVKDKLVYDANVTREVWILEPVRMKLYGVIKVDQVSDANRKDVVPTSKGQKDTRNYFTYKWHWVVKPKVLKKATKFDYSVETVLSNLCIDIKKFKYGLIKDGRLMTGNVSDADYDKYWVFHSGEEVDQAGGGNCYDMVEYEAGYLEAYGVTYKKYFMSFTKPDGKTIVNTHTICVVPHDGKYIYIEQAFKRVIDEWGHERQKTFETLDDLFYYVAEVSAEYDNQDLNFGVWDYTNEKIDYGTPIKNFQDWIFKKCKMVQDGEVKKKSDKEA